MCLLNVLVYGIHEGMEKVYNNTGGKVVVDSALNIGRHDFLIKFSQEDLMDGHVLLINREAMLVRQLNEWGSMDDPRLLPLLEGPPSLKGER